MSITNKKSGFTLLELIVYTAIFSFVILALFQFLASILVSQARGGARDTVISNTINAVNLIDYEIRHSEGVYNPTSEFGTTSGQLSLVTRNDLPPAEDEAYVDIYVNSSGKLCMKKEISGVRCIMSGDVTVTKLEFTQILKNGEPEGVRTSVEIEYTIPREPRRESFELNSFSKPRSY
ncbi:MAG: prepilin-type N-terminal cleavage/methylation domain-containing protein [Candidatus Spechtbacterales bacterium]